MPIVVRASMPGPKEVFANEVLAQGWAITTLEAQLGTGNVIFGSILGQEDEHWMNKRLTHPADRSHRAA